MEFKKIIVIIMTAFASAAFANGVYLNLENDCLLQQHRDEDYTHGTEFRVEYGDWTFKAQQNMYTPDDITRYDHIVGDRPYCGMLIGGIGRELFKDPEEWSPWTHYLEVDFGMIGPSAHCKETQRLIHKWLDCREPNGWDNQLHDEFVVNAQWWTKYNYYFLNDWAALVPRGGAAVGTIQDFGEVGCDLKIGWNLRNDVGNTIMFSSSPGKRRTGHWYDNMMLYVYAGMSERVYLYNHIIQGSLFQQKDRDLGLQIETLVGQAQVGAALRLYGLYVTWYGVFRTKEYDDQKKAPDYGGLCVGYQWDF